MVLPVENRADYHPIAISQQERGTNNRCRIYCAGPNPNCMRRFLEISGIAVGLICGGLAISSVCLNSFSKPPLVITNPAWPKHSYTNRFCTIYQEFAFPIILAITFIGWIVASIVTARRTGFIGVRQHQNS